MDGRGYSRECEVADVQAEYTMLDEFGVIMVPEEDAAVTDSLFFECPLLCRVTVTAPPSFVLVHSAGT